jgi:hypothetical protein
MLDAEAVAYGGWDRSASRIAKPWRGQYDRTAVDDGSFATLRRACIRILSETLQAAAEEDHDSHMENVNDGHIGMC